MIVDGIGPIHAGQVAPTRATPTKTGPSSFLDVLESARNAEEAADTAATRFASGDPDVGIHEVVIASEKAAIQVRYATTLKNRILESYRELMNTPV